MKAEIFDWQDIVPKTQDKDNEFLGGDHILVGSPANLNEEDVVHFNLTSTNPSLIPPNHKARRSCQLTHIRNLAYNMPVEHRAM